MPRPSRRLALGLLLFVTAALISAAFLHLPPLVAFSNDPRLWLFELTGEEHLAGQLRGVAQWAFAITRPLPQTRPDVAVAHTDLPPFGVNTFLEQEVEPEKRERSVEMIANAGFHWIRQSFPWYDIEIHGKGDFEDRRHDPYRSAWDKYDAIVDLAEAYDLEIIARLEQPPAWSRYDGTARGDFGPPDNLEDFADYAEAVVTRYRGRIRHYQVWNEPNIYPEWGNQPVDPEAYTDLLCLTYRRIKAVDPEAVVISGALAPTIELGTWNPNYEGNNLMDVVFLQRMYDAGAGGCFDVLAVNDYMLRSGPTDHRLSPYEVNFSRPMWVRDVMVANGDAHKPIWISEMNSNVVPEGMPDPYGRVTVEQQARYAPLAFERIQREWPWVGVTSVWFFKRASDAERDQPWYYFRLVEPDFTPMPVYHALADYINNLEPTLYRGSHQATSWQLSYDERWETVDAPNAVINAHRCSDKPGATIAWHWEGRSLTLIPGDAKSIVRLRDGAGRERDVTITSTPKRLGGALFPSRRHTTLTLVDGKICIAELQVR
ncbi:MAG: hypothetical protein ACP5JG_09780 [Anaerolineae bacterium]